MNIPIAYPFPVESHISLSRNDNEAPHVICSVVLNIRSRE